MRDEVVNKTRREFLGASALAFSCALIGVPAMTATAVAADYRKNPFTLDSKAPVDGFQDFLMGEVRYSSLTRTFPENAEALFNKAEQEMKERYEVYKRMAEQE